MVENLDCPAPSARRPVTGKVLIPFVVSLSNHERNQGSTAHFGAS
jgi:hypothetical protein